MDYFKELKNLDLPLLIIESLDQRGSYNIPLGRTKPVDEAPFTRALRILNRIADHIDLFCCTLGQVDKNHPSYTDEQLEQVLEHAFNHTDLNKDGYIDYLEYRVSSYKAKIAEKGEMSPVVENDHIYKDEDLIEMVEGALKQTDLNNDGYIEYHEYKKATEVNVVNN